MIDLVGPAPSGDCMASGSGWSKGVDPKAYVNKDFSVKSGQGMANDATNRSYVNPAAAGSCASYLPSFTDPIVPPPLFPTSTI